MTCGGDIGRPEIPLKARQQAADMCPVPLGKEAMPMKRYRRLMVSLGWLAAFLMAAGAGWKTS
jgi:hypothetical protein